MGTLNMLGLAKRVKARFLISSTSGNVPKLLGNYHRLNRTCRDIW